MIIAQQLTFRAKKGKEVELRTILNDMVAKTSTEKGCLKYELYQLEEDRGSFFLIEIWKSKAKYLKYKSSEKSRQFKTEIADLIDHQDSTALKLTQCLTKQNYWSEEA